MPKIELVELKNPTWHIGELYWTERPDVHYYQRVTYVWKYRVVGNTGRAIVYLPGDTDAADLVAALNSLGNDYEYSLYDVRFMSPFEVRDYREAHEAAYG